MDKIIDRLLKFFQNKSISIGIRTSILIISFSALTTSDYFFNFTYDYHLNTKIKQLESINKLKKTYESDSIKIKELTEIENRIYERTHYSDRLRNLDFRQLITFKKLINNEANNPVISIENTTEKTNILSLPWMVITSNYFFIIVIFGLVIMPFTGSVHREVKNILGSIAAIILLTGIVYLITWTAYKLPVIWNKPYLNYILNFILHTLFLYIIYIWNKKTIKLS